MVRADYEERRFEQPPPVAHREDLADALVRFDERVEHRLVVRSVVMANCIGKRELVEGKHRRGLTIAVEEDLRLCERLVVCGGIMGNLLLGPLLYRGVGMARGLS